MDDFTRDTLIGRQAEREQLLQLSASSQRRLALVTGRRRVGKTWLLTHTWPPEQTFLFTASRTSAEFNRRQLVYDLARFLGQELHPDDYPTWRSIFNLIIGHTANTGRLTVILDEFQYLAEGDRGLAAVSSELNAAWETPRPEQPLTLVLSGSAVSTMEGLAAGAAPLHGRFNLQLRLSPLDYFDAGVFAPYPDLRERALLYGVFGGMPRYLAATDPTVSLEENIVQLMLPPHGEVRMLLETVLDQEDGLRDTASYNAILRAISAGSTMQNEIAQRAGLKNDTALRAKIDRLVELGYVSSWRNLGAKSNAPFRYRLNDPALRFHQRFVQPHVSVLERVPADAVWQELRSQLPQFMGLEFERIARQAYDRLQTPSGLPLVREWSTWEGTDRGGQSLEIDVVAPLFTGGTLSGAIKWSRTPILPRVHLEHMDMLRRAADAGQRWAHSALDTTSPLLYVSAAGFAAGFRQTAEQSGHQVVLLGLDEIYGL